MSWVFYLRECDWSKSVKNNWNPDIVNNFQLTSTQDGIRTHPIMFVASAYYETRFPSPLPTPHNCSKFLTVDINKMEAIMFTTISLIIFALLIWRWRVLKKRQKNYLVLATTIATAYYYPKIAWVLGILFIIIAMMIDARMLF